MVERRKFPRVSLAVDVNLSTSHNFYGGRTRDISLGGLFIECSVGLETGTDVTVKLALDGKEYSLTCTVAWDLSDADGKLVGIGVAFKKVSEKARAAIEAFMNRREPLQLEAIDALESVPPDKKGPPPLPGASS